MIKYYAMYKGDTYLYSGTKVQLANKRNVKIRTIDFLNTPTYKKRSINSKNRIVLVDLGSYKV